MSRNIELVIADAITSYIDRELHSAVQDQLCPEDIAGSLDLDEIVEHIDLDYKFDEAVRNWIESNFDTIAEQYRDTARYVVEGMAETKMRQWLLAHAHMFEPLHRRCGRWLKQVCKNKLTWRKKND